ncbi:antiviral RADAR system adenosine triphosphatase RdrA [Pseudomonas wadenswilerensis]|uniref:antiviral RADAR system adenosine triphosphatase RdrA n=1 Tax=Pseudomonas wadenswilerensis TaxID=1785161 RepID=UPI002160E233|nr:antiviral RADAR system adenosine triphosphatase RdrA [Pseudomonas wadenswilerensis]UVM20891.1 KAP family NTPase [Pseudomonas wadenswilerensis]
MGDKNVRFIPIDQVESAYQAKTDTLLAHGIYNNLLTFIGDAHARAVYARDNKVKLDASRLHSAVLLDGQRGTGKSSVLVNLPSYLQMSAMEKKFATRVHILKPVDPTLLEDHNDLFLNVIVAAVLSDEKVREAQEYSEVTRKKLALQLQKLGRALENMQSQDDTKGLDKLRAFMGNQQLVEEVHNFFSVALELIDKDLLVLTIDDIDTSLSRAFENLEIVRRYLTTPTVLPIISGDGALYNEVSWRDFHGRILTDSNYRRADAYARATDLAIEYQRKVLPLQYRLRMPEVTSYLADANIFLRSLERSSSHLQLRAFNEWLYALLAGPVNGLENSQLVIPISSVRALAQLIQCCKLLIPQLPLGFLGKRDVGDIAHFSQMPDVPRAAIKAFEDCYVRISKLEKREYAQAYSDFLKEYERGRVADGGVSVKLTPEQRSSWYLALRDYFTYEPKGGGAYLVLTAQRHWFDNPDPAREVFDTPLFRPLLHRTSEFSVFERGADISSWRLQLTGKLPKTWLERLPESAILPYPVPEVGGRLLPAIKLDATDHPRADLLLALVLHLNYYSTSSRGRMVSVGRIVELVITSLVRDVEVDDIVQLLLRAPFYSTAAVAATKVHLDMMGGREELGELGSLFDIEQYYGSIRELAGSINEWRRIHGLSAYELSPWLVYNVFNKVMNQAGFFNVKGQEVVSRQQAVNIAGQAFNSVWAAFGSFEKGKLFGLPPIIATVNVGAVDRFESNALYIQNIQPFYPRMNASFGGVVTGGSNFLSASAEAVKVFGESVRSATYYLGDHPLRDWLGADYGFSAPASDLSDAGVSFSPDDAVRHWLSSVLEIDAKAFTVNQLIRGLRRQCSNEDELLEIQTNFYTENSDVPPALRKRFDQAVAVLLASKDYEK